MELPSVVYYLCYFYVGITLVGTTSNLAIIVATVKNKYGARSRRGSGARVRRMRDSCNLLIALGSLFDGVHTCGHIPLAYDVLLGELVRPYGNCLYLQVSES